MFLALSLHWFDAEHRLLDLLKRVQNRQYDDQRGTSLTAFKDMPEFLRESYNDNVEQMITDEDFTEKCALDESRIEVCRHQGINVDSDLQLSLSPAHCLQQNATFSDEDDIPSHENAEQYFSCSSRAIPSPDFSDPKLMERSVRDIGMESPARGTTSWTLLGNIANNPRVSSTEKVNNDFIFAVPTMPPLRIYRRQVSMPVLEIDGQVAAHDSSPKSTDCGINSMSVDTCVDESESCDSSATPSPTTHDLVLVGSDCAAAEPARVCCDALAPIVDPEDSGEEFGIV